MRNFTTFLYKKVAEMLAVSPNFHGQFATCGNWRQGCPPWHCTDSATPASLLSRLEINLRCPTTRHEGACGERKYSSYSFSTLALDWGEWSASHPGR
jgi:hypothetical protein